MQLIKTSLICSGLMVLSANVFAGTVLMQSGRETETFLIVMAVFLGINLSVSAVMNWLNRRVSLQVVR